MIGIAGWYIMQINIPFGYSLFVSCKSRYENISGFA
nr:MAG TPA: hypothetical protein [Caudoviricetes sp.]